ncbi:MAG: hypothetical protein AXW17_05185 [Colwellia sp. Phe_37]|nr:MAG: hypothetical protein AXW17_05185 [Colwellia sp. Phe_37]
MKIRKSGKLVTLKQIIHILAKCLSYALLKDPIIFQNVIIISQLVIGESKRITLLFGFLSHSFPFPKVHLKFEVKKD